MTHTSTSHYFF